MFGKEGYSNSYTYAEKRLFYSYFFFGILIIIIASIPYINDNFKDPKTIFNDNFVPLINIVFLVIPFIFTYSIESVYKIRAINKEVEGFEKTKQFLLEENEIKQFSVICATTIVFIYFSIMFLFLPQSLTSFQLFVILLITCVIIILSPYILKLILNLLKMSFNFVIDILKMLTPSSFKKLNIYLNENKKILIHTFYVIIISVIICFLITL
ncbi:hypothetical protein J9174_07900 [Macrococcoides canis]|uniref:hypothetical protein n=1 Tax=Macrococcoides canis TaxID=1855823 RepID=UPI001AEBCF5A|nr:hypothetical protein [Macrococcus canis]QTQ07357.1 hypothetical protein J9174_07900 [Macrococcus canis]